MLLAKKHLSNVSVVALVAANTIPVFGVVCLGWDAFYVVLLYWAENLIVGFYNILKMVLAQPFTAEELKKLTAETARQPSRRINAGLYHASKLLYIPFFAWHYGAFAAGHGFAVLMMFGKGDAGFGQIIQNDHVWPCFLVFIQLLIIVIRGAYLAIPTNMKYALAALFASHGISFFFNYVCRGGYKTSRLDTLMAQPYSRVVVMHIAIIAGGFITMALGSPVGMLIMLIILKTIIDVKLHLRQHAGCLKPRHRQVQSSAYEQENS